MPQFVYKARKTSGEVVEGSVESADKATALSQIDRLGLFPVSVRQSSGGRESSGRNGEEKKPKKDPKKRSKSKSAPRRARKAKPPKMQELAEFSRQLANLLKSGMTVTVALGSMTNLEIKGIPQSLVEQLRQDVMEGKNLSVAMAAHPSIFTEMYINLVRAGEQSGSLVEVLRRLASHFERFAELRHKLITALVYPAFVLVVGVAMIFFFMFFMMPRFEAIFSDLAGEDGPGLPFATEMLMTLSRLLSNPWVLGSLIAFVIMIYVLIRRHLSSPSGRRDFDAWVLRAPIISRIARPNLFGQFASTLGALLQNGVPVLTALRITEQVVPNLIIRDAIEKTREGVTDGKTIAQPLARSKVFPQLMVDMVHIGEQTGDVPGALNNVAETYESDLMVALRVVTTLIEPLLIVLIAVFVGFLLYAVMSAMFSITSSIGG